MMNVAALKEYLKTKNLNLTDLSKMSGISRNTLYSMIRRDGATLKSTDRKICQALGLPEDYFSTPSNRIESMQETQSMNEDLKFPNSSSYHEEKIDEENFFASFNDATLSSESLNQYKEFILQMINCELKPLNIDNLKKVRVYLNQLIDEQFTEPSNL